MDIKLNIKANSIYKRVQIWNGIFDLTNVVSNYVKADHLCATNAQYKTATASGGKLFPLHLIDKYSLLLK